MRNVLLTTEYDGTAYCGWQVQPNGVSVESKIVNAIYNIMQEKVKLYASGRTDAGVHAFGQCANFHTETNIPAEKIPKALNTKLPADIRIIGAEDKPEDFHCRYHSKEKTYIYKILNREYPSPLLNHRVWHIPYDLDTDKMKQVMQLLQGEHDFRCFMASGSSVKDTIRTVYSINLESIEGLITMEITGNGFLYNMVRNIMGTLVEIGAGKRPLEDMIRILESKDRNQAGITAPAEGLYLKEVKY
jgi:tRNA pseudouridine38-40 synthase